MIHPVTKVAAVLGTAALLSASVATTSDARNRWVGPAVGFGAGVLVGSAIAANSRAYYGPPPYDPYYVYPAPAYVAPAPYYGQCWVTTDRDRGFGYYRPC